MFYELFISLRYLKAKRRNRFISLITWISIGGVAVGVTALIVVLSVMSGFEIDIRDKILGITSHVVVHKLGEDGITDYGSVINKLSAIEGIRSASPFIQSQVMLTSARGGSAGVIIHGILPEMEKNVTDIGKYIVEGDLSSLSKKDEDGSYGIIVGKELYKNLSLFGEKELTVISPLGRMTPGGMIPKSKRFKIAGRFDSGMYEYDSSFAFISLEAAKDFFNMEDSVTGVEVRVNDIYKAEMVSRNIQDTLGMPFDARSWMQMNKNLFAALKREKVVMFMILALIILVAAFNIVSTLIMVVMEKKRDIAVLKAMGSTNFSIVSIFMLEGIIIGGIGTSLGFSGGVLIVKFLGDIEIFLEKVLNTKVFPSDVYYLDKLPAHIEYFDIILILSSALFICIAATIYPAWRASKIDPVESLRYE